jgi:hypothetical protein
MYVSYDAWVQVFSSFQNDISLPRANQRSNDNEYYIEKFGSSISDNSNIIFAYSCRIY